VPGDFNLFDLIIEEGQSLLYCFLGDAQVDAYGCHEGNNQFIAVGEDFIRWWRERKQWGF
jgi:hypothetical protein